MNENPYKKTQWIDEIKDPLTGQILTQGTRFTAQRMNNIENGIFQAYESLIENMRATQRNTIQIALLDRSSSDNVFFDMMDGQPSKMIYESANAVITESVLAGTTTLNVDNTDNFEAFTEVTIFDDVNTEDVLISSIGDGTITVQALANNYKKGANISRSNVDINTIDEEMKFRQWGTFTISEVIE